MQRMISINSSIAIKSITLFSINTYKSNITTQAAKESVDRNQPSLVTEFNWNDSNIQSEITSNYLLNIKKLLILSYRTT